MKKLVLATLLTTVALSANASEREAKKIAPATDETKICEQSNINVNFNTRENGIKQAKQKFDTKLDEVKATAKAAGVEIKVDNYNYSINSTNEYYGDVKENDQYMISGSFGFKVNNPTKAVEVMEALKKKGYNASLNVNAYRNTNCDDYAY